MTTPLPLRIAEELERTLPHEAAAELRRLHFENEVMRNALALIADGDAYNSDGMRDVARSALRMVKPEQQP